MHGQQNIKFFNKPLLYGTQVSHLFTARARLECVHSKCVSYAHSVLWICSQHNPRRINNVTAVSLWLTHALKSPTADYHQ
jgi:hypothetical protein